MTGTMVWRVKDADGNVVREGESIVSPDGVVSYDQLSDLPAGEYTIVPGPIKLEVRGPVESSPVDKA